MNLLDAVAFGRRHWRRLLAWASIAAVAGYLLSFVVPPTYRAVAVILPPDEDDLSSALSLSRRGLSGISGLGKFGSYFTAADVSLAILKSRSVAEDVVRAFHLQKDESSGAVEKAVDGLLDRTAVRIASDGTISVSVRDSKAARSAEMANRFLTELDRRNREYRSSQARRTRQFLERRIVESDSTLRNSERMLVAYQARHGSFVLPPESPGTANAAAALMAQKISAQTELDLVLQYARPQSEEVGRLRARVEELSRQIGRVPATQAGGAEFMRRVVIEQQVFALLTAQLEEARIREAMDTPTIQVLDRAETPVRRYWPRRSWMALFGGLLGLTVCMARLGLGQRPGRLAA